MSETRTVIGAGELTGVIGVGELVSADAAVTVLRFWRNQFPSESYTLAFDSRAGRCLDPRCPNFQLKLDHALAA